MLLALELLLKPSSIDVSTIDVENNGEKLRLRDGWNIVLSGECLQLNWGVTNLPNELRNADVDVQRRTNNTAEMKRLVASLII